MAVLKQTLKEKFAEYILGYAFDLTEKQINHIAKVAIEGFGEWLQQRPQEFRDFMTISKDEFDLIEEFVRRLIEELKR